MPEIPLNQYGRILAGEDEGFFLHVDFDSEVSGGYYVHFVDDMEIPTAGGDHWCKDRGELAALFRISEWRIEWLGRRPHD
jgi:hypothetical protein